MKPSFNRPVAKPTTLRDKLANIAGRHSLLDLPDPYRGYVIEAMVDAWRMGRKDVKAELEANFVQSGAEIAEQEKVFIRGGLVGCRLAAFKKFIERLLK